jgi:hypothetical protein
MTGVTDLTALCRAGPDRRPSYVAWTLDALLEVHDAPERTGRAWRLRDWEISVDGEELQVGATGDDRNAGLRAVTAAAWAWYDERPQETSGEPGELDLAAVADALRVR